MTRSYIAGWGAFHPERRVSNAELAGKVGVTDEWIREKTGIEERRYAADGVDTSDLGALATDVALSQAGWVPSDIDLLVCGTSTPDCLIPSTASYIAEKLQLGAVAFDVNAACAGFVYGLSVVDALLESQGFDKAALCLADKYSKVLDSSSRSSVLFGDTGATVLLQREAPRVGAEILDVHIENFNHGADLVKIPIDGKFEMDGPAVKRIALDGLVKSARTILDRNGVAPGDLRAFMAHQANMRLLDALGESLQLNGTEHWHNVAQFGNQGGAGVVTTFIDGLERADELNHGDLFLMTAYGSGFTGGSALLRWVDAQ